MTCDIQGLRDDAACFYAMPQPLLQAAIAALWCEVAQNIVIGESVALLSDDGNWYAVTGVTGPTLEVGVIAQPPGVNPYLVLTNLDDGLKYKFTLVGAPPLVEIEIDPAPTVEAETPTSFVIGATTYTLDLVTDPLITWQLTPV